MMEMDLLIILPELLLSGGILGLLLYGVFGGKHSFLYERFLVLLVFGSLVWQAFSLPIGLGWGGLYRLDFFALFGKGVVMGLLLCLLMVYPFFSRSPELKQFEMPLLWMLSCLGIMIMISASDLMILFLGLELQSLSLYILVALQREYDKGIEASLKYFLLGSLASGLLVYGASLIYGGTGSTHYDAIGAFLYQKEVLPLFLLMALALMIIGIGFKISLAPFHLWVPDVYEHTPSLTTTFLVGAPKWGAVMVLMRFLIGPFGSLSGFWQPLLEGLAMISLLVMVITALRVENIQRLIGFSGISHMGYAMVGLVAGNEEAIQNTLLYMLIYVISVTGFFFVIMILQTYSYSIKTIDDLKGLGRTYPKAAFFLSIITLSLAGIPPFAGFFGKFYVFLSAIESGFYSLVGIGLISSVIGAFYYLRLLKNMYFEGMDGVGEEGRGLSFFERRFFFQGGGIATLMVLFSLLFFFISNPFIGLCKKASISLLA